MNWHSFRGAGDTCEFEDELPVRDAPPKKIACGLLRSHSIHNRSSFFPGASDDLSVSEEAIVDQLRAVLKEKRPGAPHDQSVERIVRKSMYDAGEVW